VRPDLSYCSYSRQCRESPPTLALIILYEIGDIARFPRVGNFISYARLVKPAHESAGKRVAGSNSKVGNAHQK